MAYGCYARTIVRQFIDGERLAALSIVGLVALRAAAIESFFGALKAEYFHIEKPTNIDRLEAGVHGYIKYYNHERIKLGLNGLSPVEYRQRGRA